MVLATVETKLLQILSYLKDAFYDTIGKFETTDILVHLVKKKTTDSYSVLAKHTIELIKAGLPNHEDEYIWTFITQDVSLLYATNKFWNLLFKIGKGGTIILG